MVSDIRVHRAESRLVRLGAVFEKAEVLRPQQVKMWKDLKHVCEIPVHICDQLRPKLMRDEDHVLLAPRFRLRLLHVGIGRLDVDLAIDHLDQDRGDHTVRQSEHAMQGAGGGEIVPAIFMGVFHLSKHELDKEAPNLLAAVDERGVVAPSGGAPCITHRAQPGLELPG